MNLFGIGNSFTDNSFLFVPHILRNLGVKKSKTAHLYVGGCSIDSHVEFLTENKPQYEFRMNYTGKLKNKSHVKMIKGIRAKKWDVITMQQASHFSGIKETYEKLPILMDYVKKNARGDYKLVWNMTWAYEPTSEHPAFINYDKDTIKMYNAIVDAVKTQILTKKEFETVLPSGTAIQNMRTTKYADRLSKDGFHLTNVGCYVVGLLIVKMLYGLDIEKCTFMPAGVDEDIKRTAIWAVESAIKNPYAITKHE